LGITGDGKSELPTPASARLKNSSVGNEETKVVVELSKTIFKIIELTSISSYHSYGFTIFMLNHGPCG